MLLLGFWWLLLTLIVTTKIDWTVQSDSWLWISVNTLDPVTYGSRTHSAVLLRLRVAVEADFQHWHEFCDGVGGAVVGDGGVGNRRRGCAIILLGGFHCGCTMIWNLIERYLSRWYPDAWGSIGGCLRKFQKTEFSGTIRILENRWRYSNLVGKI